MNSFKIHLVDLLKTIHKGITLKIDGLPVVKSEYVGDGLTRVVCATNHIHATTCEFFFDNVKLDMVDGKCILKPNFYKGTVTIEATVVRAVNVSDFDCLFNTKMVS